VNILVSAYALGLAAGWVGAFDEDGVKAVVGLQEHIRPYALLPIGYPSEDPRKPDRIDFDNLTWLNKWGEKYEISYILQPGPKREFKPIGNVIEEKLKKVQQGKKISFEELLTMLAE